MRLLMRRLLVSSRDDAGSTLIELISASAILLIVAIGTIGALTFSATSSADSKQGVSALNLANQKLEEARNLPYDDVGITYADGTYGDPSGTIPDSEAVGEFTVETSVSWARDAVTGRSEYKDIRIAVSWATPRPGRVTVASAVYGKSNLTNIGDLNVNVQEKVTGVKIPYARVVLKPAGTGLRMVDADSNADAFFGAVGIGTATITVSATDWVFDPLDLPTVNIAPDLLTSVVAYAVRPCSSVITVVDTSSTPIPSATVTLTDSRGRQRYIVTGADGLASFTGLYPDSYTVRADKIGRVRASGAIGPMSNGGAYPLTLSMTAPIPIGSVRVRVRDASLVYMQGVTVSLKGPSPASTEVTGSPQVTPSSGEVFFADVDSGTYTATCSKSGYQTTSGTAVVVNPFETIVSVILPINAAPGNLHITITASGREYFRVRGPGGYDSGRKRTSSSGHDYTLAGLAPGTYTVTPERFAAKQVQVTDGTTAEALW